MKLTLVLYVKMKYLILLVLVQGLYGWRRLHHEKHLGFLIKNESYTDAPEQWFTQILDHNNPNDGRTWQQRYYVNEEFHANNGPAFLFIGGEGAMDPIWVSGGAWIQYARQFGALCFAVEHRFYGKSHPTGDLTVESLKYLSSEQALQDLKWFINGMNAKYRLGTNTKWIAFGGSYSGALAAWLRLKFPDSVHGAVASSAPILAKVDFSDYLKVVAESLGTYNKECVNAISQAIGQINSLIHGGTEEQQTLDDKFHLCQPIQNFADNSKYISNLYTIISEGFGEIVQYNNEQNPQIPSVCGIMTNENDGKPIDRLANLYSSSGRCLGYDYSEMVNFFKVTEIDDARIWRQWIYQTCNEFGFFQTSSAHPSAFGNGFPVEYFIGLCSDVYGQQFNADYINAQVDSTNRYYGGLDINVTNVVFVHGSIDPWHALGLTRTRNPKAPVIYIRGTSHCADMGNDNSLEMQQVKAKISGYIKLWLSETVAK